MDHTRPGTTLQWIRLIGNIANLSTPAGVAVAKLGGATLSPGPRGLVLADRYRRRFPFAYAFTIGNVITTRGRWEDVTRRHPHLLQHEETHTWQYLYCAGLPFLVFYSVSLGWSVLRTGDRAAANFFERQAGLLAGNYRDVPKRPLSSAISARRGRWKGRRRDA